MIRIQLFTDKNLWRIMYFNKNKQTNNRLNEVDVEHVFTCDITGEIKSSTIVKQKQISPLPLLPGEPVYSYTNVVLPKTKAHIEAIQAIQSNKRESSFLFTPRRNEANNILIGNYICNLRQLFIFISSLSTKQKPNDKSTTGKPNRYQTLDELIEALEENKWSCESKEKILSNETKGTNQTDDKETMEHEYEQIEYQTSDITKNTLNESVEKFVRTDDWSSIDRIFYAEVTTSVTKI
jgi:hypothetical protein